MKHKPAKPRRPCPPRPKELPPKPEILAPAGSPATWAAAVRAGADAVYLGMKSFSARAFAANFTMDHLQRLVDLSHENNVRIFIAFNAALKEDELPEAARALDHLARIEPDALIVQDLGLLRLIKKYYPHFEVHASTLTGVHNLDGLNVLAEMGFHRAVLARELTLNEVARLAERAPLGVELFIHGALCFSVSGLCLMSSFLGGKGSLRGACTQPCRRLYESGRKRGYFFSPADLDATTYMERIRQMPLAALKIEGRMKSADYVYRVVRAYRVLMDAEGADREAAVEEAAALVQASTGRHRSIGFYQSPRGEGALVPHMAATSGTFLGAVASVNKDQARVTLKDSLAVGDRLRVQYKKDDSRKAFTLKEMRVSGNPMDQAEPGSEVVLTVPPDTVSGDLLFKVISKADTKEDFGEDLAKALDAGVQGKKDQSRPQASAALKSALQFLKPIKPKPVSSRGAGRRPELWYKVARTEDVIGLAQAKPDRIILPLTTANVKRIAQARRKMGALFNSVIWSLEPLVFPNDRGSLMRDIAQVGRMGSRDIMISNLGHIPLVTAPVKGRRGVPRIYGDHRLNIMNTQSERQIAELGLAALTWSVEADEKILEASLSRPGPVSRLLYLYGRPPLFTTRFSIPGLKDNLPAISPQKERFRTYTKKDHVTVISEQPVFFAPLLKYKNLAGVTAFIIDLEFDPRPAQTARDISEAVARGKPMRGASRFNLKRGLF
jgi:putative protease